MVMVMAMVMVMVAEGRNSGAQPFEDEIPKLRFSSHRLDLSPYSHAPLTSLRSQSTGVLDQDSVLFDSFHSPLRPPSYYLSHPYLEMRHPYPMTTAFASIQRPSHLTTPSGERRLE